LPRIYYLGGLDFSYRRGEAFLDNLHIKRSHEAVRQWVQYFEACMKCYFETGEAEGAVIDETEIKIGTTSKGDMEDLR